jgi:hypothetical protein
MQGQGRGEYAGEGRYHDNRALVGPAPMPRGSPPQLLGAGDEPVQRQGIASAREMLPLWGHEVKRECGPEFSRQGSGWHGSLRGRSTRRRSRVRQAAGVFGRSRPRGRYGRSPNALLSTTRNCPPNAERATNWVGAQPALRRCRCRARAPYRVFLRSRSRRDRSECGVIGRLYWWLRHWRRGHQLDRLLRFRF